MKIAYSVGFSIICLLFFTLMVSAVPPGRLTNVSFNCGDCCFGGGYVEITLVLENILSESFIITSAQLESEDGKIISTGNLGLLLPPGESGSLIIAGSLPEPLSGTTLNYTYGFHLKDMMGNSKWEYTHSFSRRLDPKPDYKCNSDQNCADNEYCSISNCVSECEPVAQGTCGYVTNHKLVNYQCCSDSDCASGESCANNQCNNCGWLTKPDGDKCKINFGLIGVMGIVVVIIVGIFFNSSNRGDKPREKTVEESGKEKKSG